MKQKKKVFRFGILIFIVGTAFFVRTVFSQQNMIDKKLAELNDVQAKIEEIEKENGRLEQEKDSLFTDENMEKIAREKLGMVKPGEKIFVDIGN